MTALYSLKSTPTSGEFVITKFDRDYNPEGTYALTRSECSCPRSHKTGCRHRTMLPFFLQTKHIDDGWFLDFDTRQWRRPLLADVDLTPPTETYEERVAEFAKSLESEGSAIALIHPQPNAEQNAAPTAPAPLAAPAPAVEREVSPSPAPGSVIGSSGVSAGAAPFKRKYRKV